MRSSVLVLIVAFVPVASCTSARVTAPPIIARATLASRPVITRGTAVGGDRTVVIGSKPSPDDIETIEVIKGPAAASLYGQITCRPIVIRTKRAPRVTPKPR